MPYRPKFTVSPRLASLLEEIAALREKVKGALVQVAWIPALQKDARARNAHASTAIEGNPLTLEEVRALADGKPLPAATERARREILNYFAGLRLIERRFAKRPVAHADVLRLHKVLSSEVMDQGEAGRYRRFCVRVGRYHPPPPADVRSLMTDLLAWWNADSAEWPAVVSSAVLHFRFEEIHPFGDGNGRTGRLLALWELYRRGFDTHHVFAVDEYFWENRPRYYEALDDVREREGDITGFVEFSADAVRWTQERAWLRIQLAEHRRGSLGEGQQARLPLEEDDPPAPSEGRQHEPRGEQADVGLAGRGVHQQDLVGPADAADGAVQHGQQRGHLQRLALVLEAQPGPRGGDEEPMQPALHGGEVRWAGQRRAGRAGPIGGRQGHGESL